jgi:hypothetical protein
LSNRPPLPITKAKVFPIKEKKQIFYGLLVASLFGLCLFTHRILVKVGDGQSGGFERLEELFRRLRAGCRARERGI